MRLFPTSPEDAMPQGHRDVIVVTDADAVARTAAERILARLRRSTDRFAVCLAGGSTPERLYELLAREPYRNAVSWKHVHWFWGDDRFVPHDDPRSNYGMARRLLLDRVPVRSDKIWPIRTSVENVEEAARRYETELRRFYGGERLLPGRPLFDVVLMGLGSDGHTASLFPGHAQLEEKVRWVVGVPQAGLEPYVPRVTLTFPALASSREMLFLVSGPSKREILTQVLAGADLPAAHAYSDGELVWLVDGDAAPERRDASPTLASAGSAGVSPATGKERAGETPALPRGGQGGG
jgi:6-phosphogluconolactonase